MVKTIATNLVLLAIVLMAGYELVDARRRNRRHTTLATFNAGLISQYPGPEIDIRAAMLAEQVHVHVSSCLKINFISSDACILVDHS